METIETKLAMSIVVKAMRKDVGYRGSWQNNIAVFFSDSYWKSDKKDKNVKDIYEISMQAADSFLKILETPGLY